MFDNWFLDGMGESISLATNASEMAALSRRLRELADLAAARAVELELDAKNFVMQSITERVQ